MTVWPWVDARLCLGADSLPGPELTVYWFFNDTILNHEDVRKKSYANVIAV